MKEPMTATADIFLSTFPKTVPPATIAEKAVEIPIDFKVWLFSIFFFNFSFYSSFEVTYFYFYFRTCFYYS
jgi:hypothetical protein